MQRMASGFVICGALPVLNKKLLTGVA